MQEHNFDEILDFLCSGIMSKKERENVRDELFDHLMCKYETYLAMGLDEDSAEESAINDLGDKTVIKHRLSQVHSYYPKLSMKKAMNLFIVGFVLSSLRIPLFAGIKEIFIFLGSVFMIVAMFCLRTANKKLNQAFYIQIAVFTLRVISTAISAFYFNGFNITVPFEIAINLIDILFWLLALYGLHELVKPYILKDKSSKLETSDLNLGSLAFIISILNLLVIFINIMYFIDSDFYDTRVDRVFIIIGTILGLGLNILPKISKLLWNSDHEYKIEDSTSKKWIAAVVAFSVAVVPIAGVDIFTATQKARTFLHSIDDFEMTQSEYERICENLLSYEIPEDVVYNLPKSEINKYSQSVNKSELSEEKISHIDYYPSVSYLNLGYNIETEVCASVCAVGLLDENGYHYIRILSWINYSGEGKQYDDAVFWEYQDSRLMPFNFSGQYNESFLLILSEENGKMLKNEPLDIYTDRNALTDRMTGARFESKENLLVIHAESVWPTNPQMDNIANYMFNFSHRNTVLAYCYRDPTKLYKNGVTTNNYFGYNMRQTMMLISWEFADNETEETE